MKKYDFTLHVCSHRAINPVTATCIEFAHQALGNSFLVKYECGDAWIDRLRSIAATQFMEHDWADYMIFLDDDIVFSPKHLMKLMDDLKAGYRLVGGLYPTRTGEQLASFGLGHMGEIILDRTVQEIKWLATGFMGINKTLLKDMVDKLELPRIHKGQWCECYPFFTFNSDGKMLVSEDWDFCNKAVRIGEKVWGDTDITLGHIGDKVWTINDAIRATKEREAKNNKGCEILTEEKPLADLTAVKSSG